MRRTAREHPCAHHPIVGTRSRWRRVPAGLRTAHDPRDRTRCEETASPGRSCRPAESTRWSRLTSWWLVWSRSLDVIDDEVSARASDAVDLQTELLVERGEDRCRPWGTL